MSIAEEVLRRRIREKGRITFAEFMEVALYGPGGYYTQGEPVGRRGDFYTSPSAHPAFGALIALQLEQMWRLLGAPERFHVVEPGAGDGLLARDILTFARRLEPGFAGALHYIALDRRPLSPADIPGGLAWIRSVDIPLRHIVGCVLSNELVDSLPVHRVAMQRGELREVYVTLDGDRLVEVLAEPSIPRIAAQLTSEGVRLEEGWQGEVSLAAASWMEEVARSLSRGYVMTIDYGDPAERLYSPERRQGTVMSYCRHTPQSDPYARVGRQDITAHANFTTLARAGARGGLGPVALLTQREFLRNLGMELFIEALSRQPRGQREHQANLMAMRELVKPEGLGGFRVLVQGKKAPESGLACLEQDASFRDTLSRRLVTLPVPLLGQSHLDLMAARYPHLAADWEELLAPPGIQRTGDP